MEASDPRLAEILDRVRDRSGTVLFLTGPGILVASGVPTFGDEDARWRVGSRTYDPVELATWMCFQRMPAEVWGWYLYRRARFRAAEPNAAHRAIAALERRIGDRFLLVTENVGGLHLRAGNSNGRTYQIHGNLDFVRCAAGCHEEIRPLPEDFAPAWEWARRAGDEERQVLTCSRCGGWLRPNVLWFDESTDEERFRSDSAQRAARDCALLVVVGTSGAPVLPTKMCQSAVSRGVPVVVIDTETTPLAEMAASSRVGLALRGTPTTVVPQVCEAIAAQLSAA